MKATTIGIDLAKKVFQVATLSARTKSRVGVFMVATFISLICSTKGAVRSPALHESYRYGSESLVWYPFRAACAWPYKNTLREHRRQ
jgi:hypothetical protein